MKNPLKKLSFHALSSAAALVLMGLKTWADYKKHAEHDRHNGQRCGCFSNCMPCMTEAIQADTPAR